MCFGGGPDIPPPPKQKDPILPAQPIQPQQPAGLGVGKRGDEEEGDTKRRIAKSRRKLRNPIDNKGVQTTSTAQKSSGVNV